SGHSPCTAADRDTADARRRSITIYARWRARLPAGLAAPVALAAALTGISPAGAATAPCEGWLSALPQPASPGMASNALTSVTVLSPCDAYTAGQWSTQPEVQPPLQPLIEHWD